MNFTEDEKVTLKLLVSNKLSEIHGEMIEADKNKNEKELKRLLGLHEEYLNLFKKITGQIK